MLLENQSSDNSTIVVPIIKTSTGLVELTAKECEALELAANHHTSKEIGRLIGISPRSVDQRLDSARRKLDVATRLDAVRVYLADSDMPYRVPCDPIHVAEPLDQTPQKMPSDDELVFHDAIPGTYSFREPAPWEDTPNRLLPELKPQDLTARTRLILIVLLGTAIMVLALAGLGVANALADLL